MTNTKRGIGEEAEAPPQYQRGKNYFLGIGIDDYQGQHPKLRNCVRDVSVVRDVLISQYDFEEEHAFILPDNQATRKGIIKFLQDTLKKIGTNDSLVFMYSGHGINLDDTNIGFMIPADAADDSDYINLSDVKSRLDAAKAKHIFVIFDACFSGLLLTQRDARAQNLPENFPSRYAMTSGRNHPVDDGVGQHSPFAKALIEELKQNDESLGSVMLAQRILDRFRNTGRDEDQLPAFGRISSDIEYEGQYYFYPKNFESSLARERTKRLEAEAARDMARQALETAEIERKNAETQKQIALEMQTKAEFNQQKAETNFKLSQKNARRALYFTVASVVGLAIAVWQYREATKATIKTQVALIATDSAKQVAVKEKAKALVEKQSADSAKSVALKQKGIADKKTEEAVIAQSEALRQKDNADKKSREAQENLSAKKKAEIIKYLNGADRMIALGKLDLAKEILEEALQIDNTNANVLNKLKSIGYGK